VVDGGLAAAGLFINGLWGVNPSRMWAVVGSGGALGGSGQILFWDGTSWEAVAGGSAYPALTAIHGLKDESSIFAVGYGPQFYEIRGTNLRTLESMDGTGSNLGVWAGAADSVWVVKNASDPFWLWNGSGFALVPSSPNLELGRAIFGFSANDVWGADASGALLHFDGQEWTEAYTIGLDAFTSIHGVAQNDVWATGPHALVHYDGQSWKEQTVGKDAGLYAVWAAGPDDVWVVGARGQILHGGSAGFSPVASGVTVDLFTVWGTSPRDLWIGGAEGTFLHYVPVTDSTPLPDAGTVDCKTQGQTCGIGDCCVPFRCTLFTADISVCA
jgi:hypothetical protein